MRVCVRECLYAHGGGAGSNVVPPQCTVGTVAMIEGLGGDGTVLDVFGSKDGDVLSTQSQHLSTQFYG